MDASEVWSLEETYVETHLTADHETLRKLFHDDVSMFTFPGEIVPSSGVADYLARIYGNPRKLDYEFEREGVVISGDTAITHFAVKYYPPADRDGDPVAIVGSTHVWKFVAGEWTLIGGRNVRQ